MHAAISPLVKMKGASAYDSSFLLASTLFAQGHQNLPLPLAIYGLAYIESERSTRVPLCRRRPRPTSLGLDALESAYVGDVGT